MSQRPKVWTPEPKRMVFMDYKSGRAVTCYRGRIEPGTVPDGHRFTASPSGRRKTPSLADMLNAAHDVGAEQVILTGSLPAIRSDREHWMLAVDEERDGWEHGQHWLVREPRIGRYKNTRSGRTLEVRPASEWFNDAPVDQLQAREAWVVLSEEVEKVTGWDHNGKEARGAMFITPSATGANLWGLTLPKRLRNLPGIPMDIAEELHGIAGQHRIQHLTTTGEGDRETEYEVRHFDAAATPRLDTFSYVDGRFMYSSLGWGLGLGAHRIGRHQAHENISDSDPGAPGRYVRAYYHVRATVPRDWNHVGLLPLQAQDSRDRWLYPNKPGATFDTWADGAEIMIACDNGWHIEAIEGIVFGTEALDDPDAKGKKKPNVLDGWASKLNKARENVQAREDLDPTVRQAVAGALRSILLQGIGNFAKRLRGQSVVVKNAMDVPPQYARSVERFGSAHVYEEPGRAFTERERGYYRPELAVQVWGRARARMLRSPVPGGKQGGYTGQVPGMLSMDPRTILGVRGDAVYSSEVPPWALPVREGGADDGKNGRLRIKGVLHNVPTPTNETERNELRIKAEEKGWDL